MNDKLTDELIIWYKNSRYIYGNRQEIYNNTESLKFGGLDDAIKWLKANYPHIYDELSNAADQKDKDRIGKIKNRLDYLAAAVGLVADLIAILEVLS